MFKNHIKCRNSAVGLCLILCVFILFGSLYQNCAPESSKKDSETQKPPLPSCENGATNAPSCDQFGPCIYKDGSSTQTIENDRFIEITEPNGCTRKKLSCHNNVITEAKTETCVCEDPVTKAKIAENQSIRHLSREPGKGNCAIIYSCKNSKIEINQTCQSNGTPNCVFWWSSKIIALNDKPVGNIEVSSTAAAPQYFCTKIVPGGGGGSGSSTSPSITGGIALSAIPSGSAADAVVTGSFTLAPASAADHPLSCKIVLTSSGQCEAPDPLVIKPNCVINSFPTNAPGTSITANTRPLIDLTILDPSAVVEKINYDCGDSYKGQISGKTSYQGTLDFKPTSTKNCVFSISTTYNSQEPIACTNSAGNKARWELAVAPSTDAATTCTWDWDPTNVAAGGNVKGKVAINPSATDTQIRVEYQCEYEPLNLPISLTNKQGEFLKSNVIPQNGIQNGATSGPECMVIVKDSKGSRACDGPTNPLHITGSAVCPKYYKLAGSKQDETKKVCVADVDNFQCLHTKDKIDYPGYSGESAEIKSHPAMTKYVRNAYCLILNRDPGNPARQPFLSTEPQLQPAGGDLGGLFYFAEWMTPSQANSIPGVSFEGIIQEFLNDQKFIATISPSITDQELAERLASAILFKGRGDSIDPKILDEIQKANGNDCYYSPVNTITDHDQKVKYCKFIRSAEVLIKTNDFNYYTNANAPLKAQYSKPPKPYFTLYINGPANNPSPAITNPDDRGTLRNMHESLSVLYKHIFSREIDGIYSGYKTGVIAKNLARLSKYYGNQTKAMDIYDVIVSLYLSEESFKSLGASPKATLKNFKFGIDKITEEQIHLIVTDLYNRFLKRDPMTTSGGVQNGEETACTQSPPLSNCGQLYWEEKLKNAISNAASAQQTVEAQKNLLAGIIREFLVAAQDEIKEKHLNLIPQ